MPRNYVPPTYRRRLIRGRAMAYLTLTDRFTGRRKDFVLGPYGSQESHQRYARLLAEWSACHGRLPDVVPDSLDDVLTIDQLVGAWWEAEAQWLGFSAQHMVRSALEVLIALYGETPAVDFGPIALRAVREKLVAGDPDTKPRARKPWSRKTVNEIVDKLRSMFRWAAGQQLLPIFVFDTLKAVERLKAGRSEAREAKLVPPVDSDHVDAILLLVSDQVRTMVTLQRLTGMRSGEVCAMRLADLDMRNDRVWVYSPQTHKTAHLGKRRSIYLGPQAIRLLQPYVKERRLDAPLFSPAEAETARLVKRRAKRTTPMNQGNRPGLHLAINRTRKPGKRYSVDAYRRAITRACDVADQAKRKEYEATSGEVAPPDMRFVPRWHPHQLRHTYATRVRARYGLEAAQILLGHSSALVTDAVYAERDMAKAQKIAQQIG